MIHRKNVYFEISRFSEFHTMRIDAYVSQCIMKCIERSIVNDGCFVFKTIGIVDFMICSLCVEKDIDQNKHGLVHVHGPNKTVCVCVWCFYGLQYLSTFMMRESYCCTSHHNAVNISFN